MDNTNGQILGGGARANVDIVLGMYLFTRPHAIIPFRLRLQKGHAHARHVPAGGAQLQLGRGILGRLLGLLQCRVISVCHSLLEIGNGLVARGNRRVLLCQLRRELVGAFALLLPASLKS